MFGIGMPEMLVLLAVALIVFGPKKLPELAKSLGRALGEFKRATSDLKQSIETETGLDEVRHDLNEVKDDIQAQADLAGNVPDPKEPSAPSATNDPSAETLTDSTSSADEMSADGDADTPKTDPIADPDTPPSRKPQSHE